MIPREFAQEFCIEPQTVKKMAAAIAFLQRDIADRLKVSGHTEVVDWGLPNGSFANVDPAKIAAAPEFIDVDSDGWTTWNKDDERLLLGAMKLPSSSPLARAVASNNFTSEPATGAFIAERHFRCK